MVFTLLKTPCLFVPINAKEEKMDSLNSFIVPGVIGVVGAVILYFIYKDMLKSSIPEKREKDCATEPKKTVKLFTSDGVLLNEYKDVYVTHWDANIYLLKQDENKNKITINKGANMLLTIEDYNLED